jgi:hypothetical protein
LEIAMNEITNVPELDIDPYAAENLIDPYPMHQRIREAGPVVRLTRAWWRARAMPRCMRC